MGLGPFGRLFRTELDASGQGTMETGFLSETKEVKEKEPKIKLEVGVGREKAEDSSHRESGDFTMEVGNFETEGQAAFGVFDTVNEKVLGVSAGERTKNYFQSKLSSFFEKNLDGSPVTNFSEKLIKLFPSAAKYISDNLNKAQGHKTTAAVLGLFKNTHGNSAEAVAAYVGDSSIYHLSEGELTLLTPEKHTRETPNPVNPNMTMVRFDRIISAESTMSAGGRARADLSPVRDVKSGDVFLLATDGALKGKSEAGIKQLLLSPRSAQDIARDFTAKDLGNKSEDRAAVVVKVVLEQEKAKHEVVKIPEKKPGFVERNQELLANVAERKKVLFKAFSNVKTMVGEAVQNTKVSAQRKGESAVLGLSASVRGLLSRSDKKVQNRGVNLEEQMANSSVLNPLELPSQQAEEKSAEPDVLPEPKIEVKSEPEEIKKEIEKPAVQRQIWKRVWKTVENTDWKGVALAGASGSLVRIGAKAALDTAGLGVNAVVGGFSGAASAGVREYWQQRKALAARTEKLVDFITNTKNIDPEKKLDEKSEELLTELKLKKQRGEKMSAKDLVAYFQVESANVSELSGTENKLRSEILEKLDKLKIDKKKIASAAIKGAAAGALGATIAGEFLAFGSERDWFGVPAKTKEWFGEIYKSLGYGPKPLIVEAPVPIPGAEKLLVPPTEVINAYQEKIQEKVYQATFEKTQSLTIAARNLVHDYLTNENVLNKFGKSSNLSIEQMVYAEDYLRRKLEALGYGPNTNFGVQGELVAEAVEKSKHLTHAQIENLKQLLNTDHKLSQAVREFLPNLQPDNFVNESNDLIHTPKVLGGGEVVKELTK
ncbi:MAG: hypothetical protein JNN11_01520 [Candidatus Doudnabacteria bacterium]|nr:hypothetical protein [Candidatus Doudnabacteria bacterium]